MYLDKAIRLFFFFTLATIPIIFGARHPLVHGTYTFLLLTASGLWLLNNTQHIKKNFFSFNNLAPVAVIVSIFVTALSLPLFLVAFLSPVRAAYLADGAEIAGLRNMVTSLSYYAPGSMFYAVYGTGLYLFFKAYRPWLYSEKFLRQILWLITIAGTVEAVYGLLQVVIPSLGVLWLPGDFVTQGSAKGTIIYRNQYAAFLNMCWPMALALGTWLYKPVYERYTVQRKKDKKLSFADRAILFYQKASIPFWCAGLMILALVFSRSRGGILVMFCTAALFISLLPLSRKSRLLSASTLCIFVLTYGSFMGFEDIAHRFTFFYQSAVFRIELWISSLSMLKEHFVTGIGMGSYEYLSPVYLQNVPDSIWFDRAHNEYVELAIELGFPVMLLFLVWILQGMTQHGRRILRTKKEKLLKQFKIHDLAAAGALSALAGFMLHASVDFVWRLPANIVYAVALLAILSSSRQRAKRKSTSRLHDKSCR